MNADRQAAIATLERCMPETDAISTWRSAYDLLRQRRRGLAVVVALLAGVPLTLVLAAGAFLLLTPLGVGIKISIWLPALFVTSALWRAIFASVPGFGWAKELKQLSELLAPYQTYLDWRDGKERAF